MAYLGSWKIDDYLTFYCNTHDPDTGVATDADAVPTYRVYEDETGAAIANGSMALLDDANTVGFYSERIQLTTAIGYEKGKCYVIYITATVDSDAGTMHHTFQMEAEVDANVVSDSSVATAAALTTVDTVVDGIKAVTDNLPDSGALSDLATILADTNELQTDDVPGLIGALNDPTVAAIADGVWDEVLTSATHDVGYSAGQRLRLLILDGATAQAGSTATTIKLAAASSATDDIYTENIVSIVSGTGAGQTRLVVEYDGTDKIATVDREWAVTPDATSVYELLPFVSILLATHGTAQAGAASTITLATNALAITNSYVGCAIYVQSGTGAGQTRLITAYTAGRVATVSPAWDTQPDNTSVYKVLPVGRSIVDSLPVATQASIDAIEADTNELQGDWADGGRLDLLLDGISSSAIADAVWDEATTGHTTSGTFGEQCKTDVDAILADTNELQTDWADGGRLDLLLDAATAGAGAGAITFTYTLTSTVDSSPVPDADVWVTSDQAGTNVLASGTTDANGQVVFYLDAGTVYVWRQKSGWNFTNPDTETVA